MTLRGSSGLSLVCVALAAACAADDSDVSGVGGSSGFGGVVTGGTGGTGAGGSGGSGGSTGGSGGSTAGSGGMSGGGSGGVGGATGGSGGSGGATGGSGGATGGSGGASGGSGGSTGGSGGATGGSGGSTGGSGGATGGSGGTTGDTTPPTVTATTPAPATTGVQKTATIAVTFSEAMLLASLTASTSGSACAGSIQVSADNFATCVAMNANPVASAGNSVFTVTPSSALASLGAYKVRVTTAAKDASGNALAAVYTASDVFTVRYFHTITIDGNNDFVANETFTTSSAGYTGYVAWDEGYLYVGMKGTDVGIADVNKWLVLYFSGAAGTTTGVAYKNQQPSLPFNAQWHARWRADNTYTNAQVWSTSTWSDAAWSFSSGVFKQGNFVEMRVPFVNIGSPTTVSLHMGMLNEQTGGEWSYAAVPSTSHTDGYDPNYAKYIELALAGSVAPNASPIKP